MGSRDSTLTPPFEDREDRPLAGAPELLGDSDAIRRVRDQLEEAAGVRCPVLVTAEPGSDAEAVARELYARQGSGPYVVVECATAEPAGPERDLIGARPRGREAGDVEIVAPESALSRAARGVLFLRNITDLSADAQRRLARLLRDRELQVCGGPRVPFEARVIASAPPAVDEDAREGRLRPDLHRLLCGICIDLPPLRARPDDVRLMSTVVARDICTAAGVVPKTFTQAALTLLAALPWRGNTRELVDLLEAAVPAAPGSVIRLEEILAHVQLGGLPGSGGPNGRLRDARERFEREYITAVLRQHRWRMSAAARALGIQRTNLYRKVRQLGLRPRSQARRTSS